MNRLVVDQSELRGPLPAPALTENLMAEIGAYEAKTHLPSLLRRVEGGERITITRHGVPVAELVPPGMQGSVGARSAIEELETFGDGRRLGPRLRIRDLVEEGRR